MVASIASKRAAVKERIELAEDAQRLIRRLQGAFLNPNISETKSGPAPRRWTYCDESLEAVMATFWALRPRASSSDASRNDFKFGTCLQGPAVLLPFGIGTAPLD